MTRSSVHATRVPPRPAPADRARTLLCSASQLRLCVGDLGEEVPRHVVDTDGSLLFLAPLDSPAAVLRVAPRLPSPLVSAVAVDVASVPQADRVRGRVRLTGRLERADGAVPEPARSYLVGPDPQAAEAAMPLLRLRPERVALAWWCEDGLDAAGRAGAPVREVPLAEYVAASPDPLVQLESAWLPHLARDHRDEARALAAHAMGGLADAVDVRPLALDRHGVVLRLYLHGRAHDVRVGFDRPVTCGCDLHDAVTTLVRRAVPGHRGLAC